VHCSLVVCVAMLFLDGLSGCFPNCLLHFFDRLRRRLPVSSEFAAKSG